MSNWREHVLNRPGGHKVLPKSISPGGHVDYWRGKWPQLPPPEVLIVDFPFIRIDNWEIRFYPLRQKGMDWLSASMAAWARKNNCPEYRRYLTEFVSTLERITQNPPARTRRSWP